MDKFDIRHQLALLDLLNFWLSTHDSLAAQVDLAHGNNFPHLITLQRNLGSVE